MTTVRSATGLAISSKITPAPRSAARVLAASAWAGSRWITLVWIAPSWR